MTMLKGRRWPRPGGNTLPPIALPILSSSTTFNRPGQGTDMHAHRDAASWLPRLIAAGGVVALVGLALSPLGCKNKSNDDKKGNGNIIDSPVAKRTHIPPRVRFTDISKQAGIDFVHNNGSFGLKLLPETMGSGVAFIDFDQDGLPDLLIINS